MLWLKALKDNLKERTPEVRSATKNLTDRTRHTFECGPVKAECYYAERDYSLITIHGLSRDILKEYAEPFVRKVLPVYDVEYYNISGSRELFAAMILKEGSVDEDYFRFVGETLTMLLADIWRGTL